MENLGLENGLILSIAVHGMNCTANPEGLISMLLVFESAPKKLLGTIEHLSPNQSQRFSAMESSRKGKEHFGAQQRLKLPTKLRMKGINVFSTYPGSQVLVC